MMVGLSFLIRYLVCEGMSSPFTKLLQGSVSPCFLYSRLSVTGRKPHEETIFETEKLALFECQFSEQYV